MGPPGKRPAEGLKGQGEKYVRRHAKASSAASTSGQIGLLQRSHRARLIVLSLATSVFALAITTTAFAAKEAVNFIGSPNVFGSESKGGEFNEPGDVAVNSTGVGAPQGTIYVVDEEHHRVQRFDSEGTFVSAWGADVSLPDGGTDYEICTVAAECQAGASSGGNGTMGGNGVLDNPQAVAVDGDTGNVYVSDRDNRRVNVYDASGNFLFSVGRDVQDPDGGTAVEICDGATDACRQGDGGSGPGEIGSSTTDGVLGIAVSQPDGNAATGSIFLADSQNRRVNTYALDGTSPSSFGSAANFATTQPRKLAVDSRGIVFASDSNAGAEVDRYDSLNANGGGIGFLASIAADINETQTLTFSGFAEASGFRLTCPNGALTPTLQYPGDPSNLRIAIADGLAEGCGSGNFSVVSSGVMATVTFVGDYSITDVPTMTCTGVSFGAGTCAVTAETNGSDAGVLVPGDADATAGLELDPDSDGGGADQDVLYVLRQPIRFDPAPAAVQQFGPGNVPGLTAAPSDDDDRHGVGLGLSNTGGLGLDDVSGQLFLSTPEDRVYVLDNLPPDPVLTVSPITVKGETTVTFSGTVDPNGGLVSCVFQYSTDPGFSGSTNVSVPICPSLKVGGGAQPVSASVTGLDPNTRYYVRLAASRPFIPNSTTTSTLKFFDTDAAPPMISDLGAVQVTDVSARLVVTIDPRHSATAYVFEYGTTPGLGSSTAPLAIGDAAAPITVSQVVDDLSPDTTYYLRVSATNLVGTTTSASKTLHTLAEPLAPLAPRAYEQVSPSDKNYGDADDIAGGERARAAVSPDGNTLGWCTSSLFGDVPSRMALVCAPYITRRSASGWQTTTPFPEYCHIDPESGDPNGLLNVYPSPDFSHFVFRKPESAGCPVPPLDPAAPLLPGRLSNNLYFQDPSSDPPSYELLNPQPGEVEAAGQYVGEIPFGGSDDFSHVVFLSHTNQTAPPDSPPPGNFPKLYDWERQGHGDCMLLGGCLTLITKGIDDEPFTTRSDIPGAPFGGTSIQLPSSVSSDGERIFFSNPTGPSNPAPYPCDNQGCEIYMREGGEITHDVSASECTVSCGSPQTKADAYISSTPSGATAFFTSCAKLTDGSSPQGSCQGPWGGIGVVDGAKLYRWDRNGVPGNRLVDLTVDEEPSDGIQPNFRGLIGQSDDGDVVFFVTSGQIVPGEFSGSGDKIYRWRWNGGDPSVEYLGQYQILPSAYSGDINWGQLARRPVTPDGKYLLIYTKLAYDSVGDRDADTDAYRWDEADGWRCVSCQSPGVPSAGNVDVSEVWLESFELVHGVIMLTQPTIMMSDDGRVFFATPDALVPEDVNGEVDCPQVSTGAASFPACLDVYEWKNGAIQLVSSGTSNEPSRLIASTPSGDDVFFYTRQRLVGWDVDSNVDIYDARIGGGFAEPPPQPPICEGESCRGGGTGPPPVTGAGTAALQGAGDPETRPTERGCPKGKRKVRRDGKTRCIAKKGKRRKRARRAADHNRRMGR
jgi:hypothetical protein